MTLARLLCLVPLVALGCAEAPPTAHFASAAQCRIHPLAVPWAARDFDHDRSIALLARVESAARADRAALTDGATDARTGREVDALAGDGSNAFVSHDVAELATRLRQLDCAVLAGNLRDPGRALARYDQILGEIGATRLALGGVTTEHATR
jgi:hypothetical protein